MSISPDFDAFQARYVSGKPLVVWTKLVADLETPVSAYLKLADGRANSFLLESVEGGSVRGRYSIIGFKPDVIWRCSKGKAEINRQARTDAQRFEPLPGRPLETLAQAAGDDPDDTLMPLIIVEADGVAAGVGRLFQRGKR